MSFDIVFTLFLVFLNGFFVAAEFAIVKVRSSQIALQRGGLAKRSAQIIIDNLDGFLAATQLGITLASLGLGWIGKAVTTTMILNLMNFLGIELSEAAANNIAIPVAFTTITILHIVFGELAPKSIAIRYPTTTTISVATWLRAFYFVFRPFNQRHQGRHAGQGIRVSCAAGRFFALPVVRRVTGGDYRYCYRQGYHAGIHDQP
jgi:CBS domain containing-hemolysin-like protein